jgi:hypothetical protein
MKDNPESGGYMTYAHHYDIRKLYSEQQMSAELALHIGYFSPILNSNLKSVIIPDE